MSSALCFLYSCTTFLLKLNKDNFREKYKKYTFGKTTFQFSIFSTNEKFLGKKADDSQRRVKGTVAPN